MKHKIRLHAADYSPGSLDGLLSWIDESFEIEYDNVDPDFIIHSCFGSEALKYEGVRIAWLGENLQPDFNISDYALGFSRIEFGDRYRRVPLYRWYADSYDSLFDYAGQEIPTNGQEELRRKSSFCTMVVSNGNRGCFFPKLVNALTQYNKIDSGGKWLNNVGGPVRDKLKFIREGKFHIAFENTSTPGYVTEKILHAFAARTIPIYWGAPDVVKDFNPRAFINCHEFASIDKVVAEIRRLDEDNHAYIEMLEQPTFADGLEPSCLRKSSIMNWIGPILRQPRKTAYRRNRHLIGARYERQLKRAFCSPQRQLYDRFIRLVKGARDSISSRRVI